MCPLEPERTALFAALMYAALMHAIRIFAMLLSSRLDEITFLRNPQEYKS